MVPTLLAAAGVPVPNGYAADGENVLRALKGQSLERTKPIFWWWQGKHSGDDWPAYAMREGPWMLILDETKQRVELYDVTNDRAQANDVAAQQAARVARMRAAIDEWFATLPRQVDPRLQSQVETPSPRAGASGKDRPKPDRARAFQRWDKNRDGHLTLEEYTDGLSNKTDAPKRFKNFDKNGDGQLTREEFVGPGGN
jgi:N-acetylgalactosamine-6-sulfatase